MLLELTFIITHSAYNTMKTAFLFNRKYGAANKPVLYNKKAFANNVYEGF